jgi:AraC-like DNA-binding protein
MFEPRLTLAALGFAATVALGVLLAALLVANPRGNRAANRWLALFVAALALLTLGDLLIETRWLARAPHFAFTTDWLILVLGPCMWLYVRRMVGDAQPVGWRLALHFVPAGGLLLILLPLYLLPIDVKRDVVEQALRADAQDVQWALAPAALHVLAYWIAAVRALARHAGRAKQELASLDRVGLRWLKIMLLVSVAIWVSWLVGLVLNVPGARPFNDFAVPAGLYVLAFCALRQPAVFVQWTLPALGAPLETEAEPTAEPPASEASREPASKYARSRLDESRAMAYLARLGEVMELEKPWLENELTLADLAGRVGCSPHHLSQLFNERLRKTFFDYVNERRVEEVKRCLLDASYAAQPVLEIAHGAGFNSKATFNAVFRKVAGCTPSEFRRTARAAWPRLQ